jgi:FAD binding domain
MRTEATRPKLHWMGTNTETTETRAPMDDQLLSALRATVVGIVLTPGDEGYDEARTVWNAMIDRRPAVIVRASCVADAISAAEFARDNGLLFSVRRGGHNVTGSAVADGGLMLDMSAMKEIVVDPQARTATAQPGCLWSDLDAATQEFGLAVTGGQASDTGIAGLTLGGGVGQLMRFCGATVDNLLSVDLVTADGQLLTASADAHPDLFWGLRGGGGNFGVVTSFVYRLHPVGPIILGGMVLYPAGVATDLLAFYRDWMADAPDELNVSMNLLTAPPEPFVPRHCSSSRRSEYRSATSATSRQEEPSSHRSPTRSRRRSTWSDRCRTPCIRHSTIRLRHGGGRCSSSRRPSRNCPIPSSRSSPATPPRRPHR